MLIMQIFSLAGDILSLLSIRSKNLTLPNSLFRMYVAEKGVFMPNMKFQLQVILIPDVFISNIGVGKTDMSNFTC